MENESTIILNRIDRIQRYTIAVCLLNGIALLLALSMSIIIVGVHIYELITVSLSIKLAYYIFSLFSVLFVIIKLVFTKIYPLFNKNIIVLKLERKYPFLNNSLIAAFQFITDQASKRKKSFAQNLIFLLVKEAADKVGKLNTFRIINKKKLKLNITIFVCISIIFAAHIIFDPHDFLKDTQAIFNPSTKITDDNAQNASSLNNDLLLGDIVLYYNYPHYTGLKPKIITNSNGDIEAIKGSEVIINAISNQQLENARLLFNQKTIVPLEITNGKSLRGDLKLLENGKYTFEITKKDGLKHTQTNYNTVTIIEDIYPQIWIIHPNKDLIVSEKDIVKLEYKCNDDFGINDIALFYSINGNYNKRIILKNFKRKQTEFRGTYIWALNTTDLKPGDKLAYGLEAKDNDTVSGPKITRTKTYNLEIYDYEQRHNDILNLQADLLKEMKSLLKNESINHNKVVDTLSDTSKKMNQLDPLITSRKKIRKESKSVISLFRQTIKEMKNDVLADYTVYHILNNIKETFRQLTDKNMKNFELNAMQAKKSSSFHGFLTKLEASYHSEISFLKNNIPLLEKLLKRQHLENLTKTTKDLLSYKNEIDKLLNRIDRHTDTEMDKNIIYELRDIENAIKQIVKKLSDYLAQSLMPEAQNMKNLSFLKSPLSNAAQSNDLKTSLLSAKHMLNSLLKSLNNLNESFLQNLKGSYSQLLNSTDMLLEQITELEAEERELVAKTTDLKNNIFERKHSSVNDLFAQFFNKLKEKLNAIIDNVSEAEKIVSQTMMSNKQTTTQNKKSKMQDPQSLAFIKKRIHQIKNKTLYLSEMLDGWDIKESLRLSKETLQILNGLHLTVSGLNKGKPSESAIESLNEKDYIKSSIVLNKQIVNDLETFLETVRQRQESKLTTEEKNLTKGYAEIQSHLIKKSSKIQSEAKELEKNNPFFDSDIKENMGKASNLMDSARIDLNKADISTALIDERKSLYYLAQTKNSLEQSKEMMINSMTGNGIPMPSFASGFRGKLKQNSSNGLYGISTETVEIPSEEMHKVPKEFREDILNGMESNFPKKHEELNRDYFRELLQ